MAEQVTPERQAHDRTPEAGGDLADAVYGQSLMAALTLGWCRLDES
jgi:hypothetical protein